MADATVWHRNDATQDWKRLDLAINGANANFVVATERIAAEVQVPLEDRHLDLLDVAAVVFAADRVVRRGGDTRPGMGEGWRREFRFELRVRLPDLWGRAEVRDALVDAVSFLTEDSVTFTFLEGRTRLPQQDYLPLRHPDDTRLQPDKVILFSGGIDSLAGAIECLESSADRVMLVTHRSAQKILSYQDELAGKLAHRYPGRVAYVPVTARFRGLEGPETTQRSRSLLFAAFGCVLARMSGLDRIHFFENGVVSHNLPISRQIVGTMATRTTHPFALLKLQTLLSLIEEVPIQVANPYAWKTKTEVVAVLRDHDAANLIARTVSCNQVHDRSIEKSHCGTCSQCLDRRFAILATGLAEHDPTESYEIDVLTGPRPKDRQRIMALDWARHAFRLAGISEDEFAARFLGDLQRIAQGFPHRPASEVFRQCLALQRRHGAAVRRVLEAVVTANADALLAQSLPDTSLIRCFVAERTGAVALPVSALSEARAPEERMTKHETEADPASLWPLRVELWQEAGRPFLEVRHLGTVFGSPASVVHGLYPAYDCDGDKSHAFGGGRYVTAGDLARDVGISKSGIAQAVRRCRNELAEYYRAVEGRDPEAPLLIHNRRQLGYRLDPESQVGFRQQD